MDRPVIIDSNILFSALLKERSRFSSIILSGETRFYVNELVLAELFKHKERIARLSDLSEDIMVQHFYRLLRAINIFKEDLVSPANRMTAYKLCKDLDETDAPHLAIALELGGLLWTGDERLKKGLRSKGFDMFFEPGPAPRSQTPAE